MAKLFSAAETPASDARLDGDASAHTHSHTRNASRKTLRTGFYLTLLLLAVEIAGGLISHSLALLSDAGHMLTDAAALGLAWFAAVQATRPANGRRTFGYHRVGILSALINGITLVLIAAGISFEAFQRFHHPQHVAPGVMIVAALVAIAINLYIGTRLHASAHSNLNARAATLHVFGDVGASIGVVVGAVAIALTGATWVDPLVSALIAVLIALGALRLILEAGNILLESTPSGVSLPALVRDILRVRGVHDVHDLHVWTITSGMLALSCHVVIDDLPPSDSAPILDSITDMLRSGYGITHSTIQFESNAHTSHDGFCACPPNCSDNLYCALQPTESDHHAHSH